MPATARPIEVTSEDLENSGGSSYDNLEVPDDYYALLKDVEDYDKRPNGSYGWIWHYEIEGLKFRIYTAFSKAARWKLLEVLEAHGLDVAEGISDVDPNAFVGDTIGAHVDFPKEYYEAIELGETPERAYREIRWVFKPPAAQSDVDSKAELPAEPVAAI